MCGIFAFLSLVKVDTQRQLRCKNYEALQTLRARGPDDIKDVQINDQVWFGFTRLTINGFDPSSAQPMVMSTFHGEKEYKVYMMCNGEIYNFRDLIKKFNLENDYNSNSDCEIILHLYLKFGFEEMLYLLTGVFSIALFDTYTNKLYIANDRIGIRPLYWGNNLSSDEFEIFHCFASEPRALYVGGCNQIQFFKPGTFMIFGVDDHSIESIRYYNYDKFLITPLNKDHLSSILENIRFLLTQSVKRRLMSDRPIASLLSGGLDSSLVAALLSREMDKSTSTSSAQSLCSVKINGNNKLNTFSIGLKGGSPDLQYAKIVSDHIGSVHHQLEFTEKEFLDAIPEVIRAIQTWDTTTIRASVGNYLIAKYINEYTDFIVILNGDVSEEINASYYYSRFAPSPEEFKLDNIKLLKEVHQYDVLRSARCIESQGLEARTPFADQDLVNYVMSIDPTLKMVGDGYQPIEKYLFRKAFENEELEPGKKLLPPEILWRPKEAFSDGVSNKTRSWHTILKEHFDSLISDDEFELNRHKYTHAPPRTKEEYYYRTIFEEILPGQANMINTFWMPRFVKGVTDPSARVIKN